MRERTLFDVVSSVSQILRDSKRQRAPPSKSRFGKERVALFSLFRLRIFGRRHDETAHSGENQKPTSPKRILFFDNTEEGKQSPCHTPICSNISSLVIQASCFVWGPVWLSGFSPRLLSILIVHTPFHSPLPLILTLHCTHSPIPLHYHHYIRSWKILSPLTIYRQALPTGA